MANIVVKPEVGSGAPNWLGASREPDKSIYKADKSFETLFSGIGDLLGMGAKTADTYVQEKIKDAWEKDFQPVRDAQGVGDLVEGSKVGLNSPGEGRSVGLPSDKQEQWACSSKICSGLRLLMLQRNA